MLDEKELDEFTNEFLEDETPSKEVVKQDPDEQSEETDTKSDGSSVWDGATDDQRSEIKSLQNQLALSQHAASSDRGRNKALHAKVKLLEDEALKKEQSSTQEQALEDSVKYTDKELSDMRDDLPEVSAIVSQETASLKKQLADIESRIADNQPVEDTRQNDEAMQAATMIEFNKVEAEHPKFKDTVNSIEYTTWLSRQPSGVKDMARSPQADNAITVISMFKSARNVNNDHELESMVDLPHKGLTKSNLADEDDFDAQFEHFSNQFGS